MAHHGAANDDGILIAGGEATLLKYMGYGRAQWHPVITRLWNIAAGHCDDPLYERLTQANGFTNGEGGAYVVHYYPKLRRNSAGRYFLPGNDLDQLLFTAGRVFGRDHSDPDTSLGQVAAIKRLLHRLYGFGLVILDGDNYPFGI